MQDPKAEIQHRLSSVKAFLAGDAPPRLSESDTKANFIEPIIAALGWEGIGVVTREYYVRNSQEFIDYVMTGPAGLLLAIEAKPLQTQLTDKHAAQLIQYCAVEGIEWAALTNGRELQFFNSFLKPDLTAKRVLRLDLLAFNNDAEFDALFSQLWQLSRESMTTPSGVRSWLNQRRLDAALRTIVLDPSSPTIRQLRAALTNSEISATSQDVAQWFRSHLVPPLVALAPEQHRTSPVNTGTVEDPTSPGLQESASRAAISNPKTAPRRTLQAHTKTYYGITLRDLLAAGYMRPDTELILIGPGGREITRARLRASGEIEWQGNAYRSLSDKNFAQLLGRQALNGWDHWRTGPDEGSEFLTDIRARMQSASKVGASGA